MMEMLPLKHELPPGTLFDLDRHSLAVQGVLVQSPLAS